MTVLNGRLEATVCNESVIMNDYLFTSYLQYIYINYKFTNTLLLCKTTDYAYDMYYDVTNYNSENT